MTWLLIAQIVILMLVFAVLIIGVIGLVIEKKTIARIIVLDAERFRTREDYQNGMNK